MKLRQIIEGEYDGLEDNDEFIRDLTDHYDALRNNDTPTLWCMYCDSPEDDWETNELIECDGPNATSFNSGACPTQAIGHINCILQTPEDKQKNLRGTTLETFSSGWSVQMAKWNHWFCPDCSKAQITEDSDYDGLEDNDEFEDHHQWQQDDIGPVTAGPYQFMVHTLYQAESRDIDMMMVLINGKSLELITEEFDLNKIKSAILAEHPELQHMFDSPHYTKFRFGLHDSLRDVIQELCFRSNLIEVSQNPDLGLFGYDQ